MLSLEIKKPSSESLSRRWDALACSSRRRRIFFFYLGVYGTINVVERVWNALEYTYIGKWTCECVCKHDVVDRDSFKSGATRIAAYIYVKICDLSLNASLSWVHLYCNSSYIPSSLSSPSWPSQDQLKRFQSLLLEPLLASVVFP